MHIVLFFTRNVSLQTWDSMGMLDREAALYRRLQGHGINVSFVTYGDAKDLAYSAAVPGIRILCNRMRLPGNLYERLIPLLHASSLSKADLFKTNQTNGADVALASARLLRKPLVARCGYMWSDLAAHSGSKRHAEYERARSIENRVFRSARRVIVTTQSMQVYLAETYGVERASVSVIPNYVLTDLFTPDGAIPARRRVSFVGRLSEEKNPLSLVEACAGIDVELVMVGDGPQKAEIQDLANRKNVPIRLMGNIPHKQIPDIMRSSEIFVLASPHEGHPKTLLEAMSCGLPVIGANVPGIRELIRHDETGWLCESDPNDIRRSIELLLSQPELRARLGMNARSYVVNNFSLEQILGQELAVYRSVISS